MREEGVEQGGETGLGWEGERGKGVGVGGGEVDDEGAEEVAEVEDGEDRG